MAEQLGLFGEAPRPARGEVGLAPIEEELRALGARLPSSVYLGTSSWSFPGWKDVLWAEEYSEQVLARRGLTAYARHPLLRTVGIDRTHYAPVEPDVFRGYASSVPADFRFLTKAHEACTLAVYPTHPRYGTNRGQRNPLFFDPAYARDKVVAPFVEGLGATAGPLLFQLAQQPMEDLGGTPRRFAEKLYRFLRDLPKGPLYAVELRNPQLLTKDYRSALQAAGAVHCINAMSPMPPPTSQPVLEERPLVIRWMMAPHHTYESARAAYAPFNQLMEPDLTIRRQIAQLVRGAQARGQPAWVIANNKAEGCSPLTLVELAKVLDEQACDDIPF